MDVRGSSSVLILLMKMRWVQTSLPPLYIYGASWQPVPHWDAINELCARLGSLCFRRRRRPVCALPVPQL